MVIYGIHQQKDVSIDEFIRNWSDTQMSYFFY